jgi:hypothetical protein
MFSHPRALPAGFIAPCLPTNAPHPPCGDQWLREIKHDGFRVIARKVGERVKLIAETRPPTPMKAGRPARFDYEYFGGMTHCCRRWGWRMFF